MSYNIDSVKTLTSTLRISKRNARKAAKLDLPELNNITEGDLKFGEDGYATIDEFMWSGEGSGHAHHDGRLKKFVALLEGDADLIFTWEGGDSHSGLRIRGGKMKECDVVMTLAAE